MARPFKLKASKDSDSGKLRVNVPPRLSSSGRRERRFFDTHGAANEFIEELKCRRNNLSAIDRTLEPAQLLDAAADLNVLRDYPQTTLLEAARGYLEVLESRTASITLSELFGRFTQAKKYKSKRYLRDIKWVNDRLRPLHTRLVSSITRRELAAALGPLPDSSRNNMLRTLRALFRYGHDFEAISRQPSGPRLTYCRLERSAGCLTRRSSTSLLCCPCFWLKPSAVSVRRKLSESSGAILI